VGNDSKAHIKGRDHATVNGEEREKTV